METPWKYAFNNADFSNPITISGIVDLSGLGTVDHAAIGLFLDSDFVGSPETYSIEDSPSGQWSWTARTLPFNRPTDLYVALRLEFPGGEFLTRRLPDPISVYNQNVSAPKLGPFQVNHFNLSGTVDFSALASLDISINDASVSIYKDKDILKTASVNLVDGTWSLDLLGEETSPARMVLQANTNIGVVVVYDEIQRTLSGDLIDLDFAPVAIDAGITFSGAGADGEYWYLFVPEDSGYYVFATNSNENIGLSIYNNTGYSLGSTSGAPDAALPLSLTNGTPYFIKLDLSSPYQAFQFRVDPASQADLAGTVNFAGLLSAFGPQAGVTVSSAAITAYADNSARLSMGSPVTINVADGSWSATVGFAGASMPAVLVINATLSNGQTVSHQEYLAISGDKSGLEFSPTAVGPGPVFRTTISNSDKLLYVPAKTALYSLKASAVIGEGIGFGLTDATTGTSLDTANGYGEVEIIAELTGGKPYLILVDSSSQFAAYQFRSEELPPVTLSGTVSFAGLTALTGGINHTEIQVYNIDGPRPVKLGSPATVNNGAWTAIVPPAPANQKVRIVASVYLNNGRQINGYIEKEDLTRFGAEDLYLAPKAVASGEWHDITVYAGSNGTWLLWIPGISGEYVLDAARPSNTSMEDPHLYLYDGINGNPIDDNNDRVPGNSDSRIQRSGFVAGRPYLVRVTEANGAGTFKFRALPPVTLSGTVNFDGLAPLTGADINRTEIQAYTIGGSSPVKLGSSVTVGNNGVWTAIVPPALTAQTVRIVASVYLKNGGQINSHIEETIPAESLEKDTPALTPTSITSGEEFTVYADSNETWLLWIPTAGEYVLDVEETDGADPYMYLYDGNTREKITENDDGGNGYNSRIQYNAFETGQPYLVQVTAKDGAGTFRFTATVVP
jgi:sRNA-binding regulator protein Hfq